MAPSATVCPTATPGPPPTAIPTPTFDPTLYDGRRAHKVQFEAMTAPSSACVQVAADVTETQPTTAAETAPPAGLEGLPDPADTAVLQRRRQALALGAARVVPSLDLNDYADRLARLNGWLVSPFGDRPLTSDMIKFGYHSDYGENLAFEVRGLAGVALYGTEHLALDLQIPGLPNGGRGAPVVAPFDGTIIRTADPIGGPFGIWLENRSLNLRARLMHMDGLVVGIETGATVRAGQQLGILGAQGTEDFPHLHLAFERLSDGERLNPALFYHLRDWSDSLTFANRWYDNPATAPSTALRARPQALLADTSSAERPRPVTSRWGPFEIALP